MKAPSVSMTLLAIGFAGIPLVAQEIKQQAVHFPQGKAGTTITDKVTGGDSMDYLMGGAKSSGKTATFSLQFDVREAAPAKPEAAPRFAQSLELQGITFQVATVAGKDGKTVLLVTPKGLKEDNTPVETPMDGTVISAEVADINADQSPELYVYVREPGPKGACRVWAWSSNKNKSMSSITLQELPPGDAKLKGHAGKEDYAVVESVLVRRFAVDGGKIRQIHYKLKAGEAGWLLVPGRTEEFSTAG